MNHVNTNKNYTVDYNGYPDIKCNRNIVGQLPCSKQQREDVRPIQPALFIET